MLKCLWIQTPVPYKKIMIWTWGEHLGGPNIIARVLRVKGRLESQRKSMKP